MIYLNIASAFEFFAFRFHFTSAHAPYLTLKEYFKGAALSTLAECKENTAESSMEKMSIILLHMWNQRCSHAIITREHKEINVSEKLYMYCMLKKAYP